MQISPLLVNALRSEQRTGIDPCSPQRCRHGVSMFSRQSLVCSLRMRGILWDAMVFWPACHFVCGVSLQLWGTRRCHGAGVVTLGGGGVGMGRGLGVVPVLWAEGCVNLYSGADVSRGEKALKGAGTQ